MRKIHRLFPEQKSGYELSPKYGWFSILEPANMINYIPNPQLWSSTVTTWYTDDPVGAVTVARTTDEQRRGPYSLKITPAVRSYSLGINVSDIGDMVDTSNTSYVISFDILAPKGHQFKCWIEWSDTSEHEQLLFTTNGYWQRYYLRYYYSTGLPHAATFYIHRLLPQRDTTPFYLDGFMLTEGTEISTYFDGDTVPYGSELNYTWIGEPHETRSFRNGDELSTGIVRNLNDYGYHILGFDGLGLMPQKNIILENALIGGGTYQRGIDQIREYNIVGSMSNMNFADLIRNKAHIERLLRYSHTLQQPLTVRFEIMDDSGEILSQPINLRSLYGGGFEQRIDNLNQERSSLQFIMDRPTLKEDGDSGDTLSTYQLQTLTASVRSVKRVIGSGWEEWGQAGVAYNCQFHEQLGWVAYSGNFGATYINFYDIETDTWLGHFASGLDGAVHDTAVAGNNDIWIVGLFNNCGGAASDGVAYYRAGSGWEPLTGKFASLTSAYCIAISPNGYDVYVGGQGTIYHIDTQTETATNICPSGGHSGTTHNLIVDNNGNLYAVGSWTTINSVSANYIAVYDGSTWSALGTGLDDDGVGLSIGPDNNIYITGAFTSANGISASGIARYNGETFYPLGGGIDPDQSANSRHSMQWYGGNMYVVIAGTAGGCECVTDVSTARRVAMWNGSNWSHLDVVPATAASGPYDIAIDNQGTIYFTGYFASIESSVATTVNNPGTANAEPVITVKGEMVTPAAHTWDDNILWIKNETTNQTVYLNCPINQYEVITIDFRRGRKRVISDSRGDLTNTILPSSDFASFFLQPGDNDITMFIDNVDLVTTIHFTIPHDYIGGAII